MDSNLLGTLQAQCRRRPLNAQQRERIATHMHACGIAAIRERGLLFERQGELLKVMKLPRTAAGEPIPL